MEKQSKALRLDIIAMEIVTQYIDANGTTTYATTSAPFMGYHDTLLLACVFLFFVSLSAWGRIFKPVGALLNNG